MKRNVLVLQGFSLTMEMTSVPGIWIQQLQYSQHKTLISEIFAPKEPNSSYFLPKSPSKTTKKHTHTHKNMQKTKTQGKKKLETGQVKMAQEYQNQLQSLQCLVLPFSGLLSARNRPFVRITETSRNSGYGTLVATCDSGVSKTKHKS